MIIKTLKKIMKKKKELQAERLDYLLSKREALEITGRMITLKQAKEIAELMEIRAGLCNNKAERDESTR